MFVYKIQCRFCGVETGRFEHERELDNPLKEVLDSRCATCEQTNGSIKEMEKLYQSSDIEIPFEELLNSSDFKKSIFEKEFKKEKIKFHKSLNTK